MNKEQFKLLARILGIETFEARNMDGLDFHDIGVWTLKAAVQAAYKMGFEDGFAEGKEVGFVGGEISGYSDGYVDAEDEYR